MKYHECIINEVPNLCPHDKISGKICSACKLPDIYHDNLRYLQRMANPVINKKIDK